MEHSMIETLLETTTTWVAISFVIFWALAAKPITKAVAAWLDGKIARVRTDIDAAAALRLEAEQMLAEARQRLTAAQLEAADVVEMARMEAKHVQEQSQLDISAALAHRETQAMDRIALAEKQAVADIQKLAATAAVDAARSLLTSSMDDSAKAKLADAAIADISKVA